MILEGVADWAFVDSLGITCYQGQGFRAFSSKQANLMSPKEAVIIILKLTVKGDGSPDPSVGLPHM